MTDPRKIS